MSALSAPRRQALARLEAHGPTLREDAVCSRSLGRDLAKAGLVLRERATTSSARPTYLTITDAGRAGINRRLDSCDCRECRSKS